MTFDEWWDKEELYSMFTDCYEIEQQRVDAEKAWNAAIKEYAKQRLESEGIRCY